METIRVKATRLNGAWSSFRLEGGFCLHMYELDELTAGRRLLDTDEVTIVLRPRHPADQHGLPLKIIWRKLWPGEPPECSIEAQNCFCNFSGLASYLECRGLRDANGEYLADVEGI
jgi:hypothetical protein